MDNLGESELWSFYDDHPAAQKVTSVTSVRKAKGHRVSSFFELATKVAELQFRNLEHVLMFRGQGSDALNSQKNTTLKPSLLRSVTGTSPPDSGTLNSRFLTLKNAEIELVQLYKNAGMLGLTRLQRYRNLRWAILQHYEVCPTPLLDVTLSLRIAASFASQDATRDNAFLFVLAVPNLSGAITASAEAGLQIIRLASVCPPAAVRPHIQEGYLLGEYPEMIDYDQKQHYRHHEIDFGRRLLAKFCFNPKTFWKNDTFPKVAKKALYPPRNHDPLFDLAENVKAAIT